MEQSTIIALTKKYVRQMLEQDRTGHDLHHIKRVYRLANYIAEQEKSIRLSYRLLLSCTIQRP